MKGFSQADGDYRSNPPAGFHSWGTASNWERYDGGTSTWVTATVAPSAADGVITISAGDSIRLTALTTIDQVKVEATGVLLLFNANYVLNDAAGEDLEVDGRLYVSVSPTVLSGAGTLKINAGGEFYLRNGARLDVNALNEGTTFFTAGTNMQNNTFTNNGTINWLDGNIVLTNSNIVNNDSLNISTIGNISGTGSTVSNSASGVIFKPNTGISAIIVPFSNAGTIKGIDDFRATNTTANTGTIEPGVPTGSLNVSVALITSMTPTLRIQINTDGAVQGVNYDHLTTATAVNISGANLVVENYSNDPIGTVYTIFSTATGNITGTFANVSLQGSLGNLTYTSTAVTVEKLYALPLVWGAFDLRKISDEVEVSFSTLQESGTSHFVIETSGNGKDFSAFTQIAASGFSDMPKYYKLRHKPVSGAPTVFYRIRQVDKDGKFSYSVVKGIRLDESKALYFDVRPNPVVDQVILTVAEENSTVQLSDNNGRVLRVFRFGAGIYPINLGNLNKGIYRLSLLSNGKRISTKQIIKL